MNTFSLFRQWKKDYKFPSRLANRTITKGPAAKTTRRANN